MGEIGERVERMADAVYQSFNTNRKVIANNYLSVKGYAGAAQDNIMDYVQKGEGNLLSIGDFLQSVAMIAKVKITPEEGVSAGGDSIKTPFGGNLEGCQGHERCERPDQRVHEDVQRRACPLDPGSRQVPPCQAR